MGPIQGGFHFLQQLPEQNLNSLGSGLNVKENLSDKEMVIESADASNQNHSS